MTCGPWCPGRWVQLQLPRPCPPPPPRAGLTPQSHSASGMGQPEGPLECSAFAPSQTQGTLLHASSLRSLASCPHEGPGAGFSLKSPSPPHLGPAFLPDLARVP